MTSGPRLTVEVGDLCALSRFVHSAGSIEISEAGNAGARINRTSAKSLKQVLHGQFAFTEDDKVRASLKIFKSVGAWFRAANDSLPPSFAGYLENLDDIAACHQIGVDANDRWCLGAEVVKERLSIGEGGIEDVDVKALLSQMRAQVQNAKRSVGLHDLKLLGIFVEEVAVREQ